MKLEVILTFIVIMLWCSIIAFFIDVMHRVEPVTSGIRIVLQYDILVDVRT
jgi:hypothetical protein